MYSWRLQITTNVRIPTPTPSSAVNGAYLNKSTHYTPYTTDSRKNPCFKVRLSRPSSACTPALDSNLERLLGTAESTGPAEGSDTQVSRPIRFPGFLKRQVTREFTDVLNVK
ncbi:hypothetical protein FRB93_008862 [Tulasnella sp. JGI-2019a]|nr:hypothetical protein FRB93_008862 [Tulasnella sp. JGI-2019a]